MYSEVELTHQDLLNPKKLPDSEGKDSQREALFIWSLQRCHTYNTRKKMHKEAKMFYHLVKYRLIIEIYIFFSAM